MASFSTGFGNLTRYFPVEAKNMRSGNPTNSSQNSLFDMVDQRDDQAPWWALGRAMDGSALESAWAPLYRERGRAAQPIRRRE